jgi:hypothetical protein
LALQGAAGNAAVARLLAPASRHVARYTTIAVNDQTADEWPAGAPLRLSVDGAMAVAQDTATGSHRFWATFPLIARSNASLVAAGSPLRLRPGSGGLSGSPPMHAAVGMPQRSDLIEVEPENTDNQTRGTTMDIWADCGQAAREVMGIGAGTFDVFKVTGTYVDGGKEFETDAYKPEDMANEIITDLLGEDGWAKYHALPPDKRDAFDKEHGINKYATPEVGEAFAMDSSNEPNPKSPTQWNFHYAGVVMQDGQDTVTLENYAYRGAQTPNKNWVFQMYGPLELGQSFHDEHAADAEHGDDPTTVEARRRDPSP